MKPKPKKPLYVGRTEYAYEIGTREEAFTHGDGFALDSFLVTLCPESFERNVGKLEVGEVRRLHVRIGREAK